MSSDNHNSLILSALTSSQITLSRFCIQQTNYFNYLLGKSRVYRSSDSICKSTVNYEAQECMYPVEFLNTLKFNGIPNHKLELKIGAPII